MSNDARAVGLIMGIVILVLIIMLSNSYDVQNELKEKMISVAEDIDKATSKIEREAEDAQSLFKQLAREYNFDYYDSDVYYILLGLAEDNLYPFYEAYEELSQNLEYEPEYAE